MDVTRWKNEFSWKNCLLEYEDPHRLHLPQWGRPSAPVLVWRWLSTVYFIVITVWPATVTWPRNGYIFLTRWALIIQTVTFLLKAVTDTAHFMKREHAESHGSTPIHTKLVWSLQNVIQVTSLMVTVLYWCYLYRLDNPQGIYFSLTVNAHLVNFVVIFADFCIIGIPVRLLHAYHPQVLALMYALFLVVLWLTGQDSVYGTLTDFTIAPVRTSVMLVGGILIVIPVLHLLVFVLYLVKVALYEKCLTRTPHESGVELA